MKRFHARARYLATVMIAIPALSTPVFAQDSGSADSDNGGVKEIVVTAQRQEQSVLEVPLSIQALSGDQLAGSGIRQMSDLQLTTPGFVPSNSSGYNQMFIRGIGNAIFVGADPSVATFIDDVPRVFGTLVNNFVDVERVEVIKGAPGALYGRNATGGAVNIITRQPSTEAPAGTVRASFGEKHTFQASAFVNLPITDNIAWTISGERRSHDPYVKNITRDKNAYTAAMFPGGSTVLGTNAQQTADFFNSALVSRKGYANEDFWAVSSKLLVRPSDNFKITFAGDYSKKDDDNGNGLYQDQPAVTQGTLAFFLANYAGTTPNLPANFFPTITKKFTTAQRGPGFVKLKDYGLSATAVLELEGMDLTSITSYRKNHSDFLTELGFNATRVLEAHVDIRKKTFYQELRAVSTGDGPLHYIAGASYLRAQFDGGLVSNIIPPLVMNLPSGQGGYVVKNWSAYAQLGYDVTDNLSLTASGRYVHEKNRAHQVTLPAPIKLSEEKFLPSVTISYKLDGGGNVYARWARGFKAGGIVPVTNLAVFPDPETQGGIFKGEEVDFFEAGVRTPLFGNKAQFTAAIFYNDYKNVQVGAHANPFYQAQGVTIAVVNAGSARTYGAEAGITARVADPLTLGASVGYLNAKYKDLEVPATNPVLEPFDLSGGRMINAPKWQLSFNADLDQPVSDDLRLVGSAVVSHTSRTIWIQAGASYLPDAVEPGYWLVNARLGVRTADDKYELAVYAKNLFNAAYTTYGSSSASTGNQLAWGDPRIVGLEGTIKF